MFLDDENIPAGVDWRQHIDETLGEGAVVLALVGPTWISDRDQAGARIIDNPANENRREIENALKRERLVVVPVLVNDARMPGEDELPLSLRAFAGLNARKLRRDAWPGDIERLVKELGTKGFAPSPWRWRPRIRTRADSCPPLAPALAASPGSEGPGPIRLPRC